MAASALPETLKSITATKIQELTQQRDNFESAKAAIYAKTSSAKNELAATGVLLDGTRQLRNVRISADDSDDEENLLASPTASHLRNQARLLRQATVDPSVESSVVSDIRKSIERELELESVRHKHAQFFSELVTEWLSNPDEEAKTAQSTNFEEVGRKEMHEQRSTWESLVFTECKVDVPRIEEYLNKLFTPKRATTIPYEEIVKQTKSFASDLWERRNVFDPDSLKRTMSGLLQSDLLSEEKNATVRTFMTNKEVLKEVADVLNMRYASLSSWKWATSGEGIPVEMRRQLNGKYRVFMDEDLLDALLLYEIGMKWAVHFKKVLKAFFDSFAWNRSVKVIPKNDRERRNIFIPDGSTYGMRHNVEVMRRTTYANDYFLTQLPVNENAVKRNYDEDNSDDGDRSSTTKSPLELKHGLLHMLVAELLIGKAVHPNDTHTVIRSDFKWFGPALPHQTVYTVLKFFGVDSAWLKFFRTFLEAPLFFVHDGPKAQTQTRKRGIPMSHTLSDVFGEVVLFVMDFALNQATSSYLYRLHDDFWLWGSEEVCLQGWQAMTQFASIMGIEFNEEKTGTVHFGATASSDTSDSDASDDEDFAYGPKTTSLPTGEVRWGFLRLDAASGRFLVDQSQVDEHVQELKLQLSYCKSIFSYIQSYNAYVGRFFTNNFGKPSYAFGRDHVDMMIKTFARIQRALFPSGNVIDHLANQVEQHFGIKDLPQGFWYFPIEQGGTELRNPLIPLLGMRESLRRTPERMIAKSQDLDEAEYLRSEASFKEGGGISNLGKHSPEVVRQILDAGETFMPREEYFRYQEQQSKNLADLYMKLMTVPPEEEMEVTAEFSSLLSQGSPDLPGSSGNKTGLFDDFTDMQPYWKWMVALYGKEIVEKYGSVRMVDGGQVPIGVVSLMKKGRVRWRG